jgi:hypothetical protein
MNWFAGFSLHYFALVCKTKRNQFIIKCQHGRFDIRQGQSLEYTSSHLSLKASKERNMIGKGDQTAYFQQNGRRAGNGFNMTTEKNMTCLLCIRYSTGISNKSLCNLKYKNLFLSKL